MTARSAGAASTKGVPRLNEPQLSITELDLQRRAVEAQGKARILTTEVTVTQLGIYVLLTYIS